MLNMLWTGEYDEYWAGQFSKYASIKRASVGLTGKIFDKLSGEALIEALQRVDVFLIGYDNLTEEVLKKSPDLKLVLSVRDGPEENIDIKSCERMGIPVFSSAGRCTVSVAEYTFLMMLLMARPVIEMSNIMRKDGWTNDNRVALRAISETSSELYEKTLGIIGMGRNGRHLAKLAIGFGMKVIGYDPYADAEELRNEGVICTDLESVMSKSDYVTVLARLTPETEGMVNEGLIARMKETACFINTARAKLVDTNALLDALESGKIRKAALDVFDTEPVGTEHRIYRIPEDKLIVTPHGAGMTVERVHHQSKSLYQQMEAFFRGERSNSPFTRNVYEREEFKMRGGKLWGMNK